VSEQPALGRHEKTVGVIGEAAQPARGHDAMTGHDGRIGIGAAGLADGARRARAVAEATMAEVRAAVKLS